MLRHFGFLFRIDRRIYLSLGIVLLLSIILLLIQYFRRVDCESAKFLVSGDMSIDKVVEFYDNTPNAKNWEWDFGDGSAPDYRQRTLHQNQFTSQQPAKTQDIYLGLLPQVSLQLDRKLIFLEKRKEDNLGNGVLVKV